MKVLFDFRSHANTEDANSLCGKLDGIDVLVPEMCLWKPAIVDSLQAVANGEVTPRESGLISPMTQNGDFSDYQMRLLEGIHGTHVKIVPADLPDSSTVDDEVVKRYEELARLETREYALAVLSSNKCYLAKAMSHYKEYLKFTAEAENLREEYILKRLRTIISETVAERGPDAKILVTLGTEHANLYAMFKESNTARSIETTTTHDQGKTPVYDNYHSEAKVRTKLGETVDDNLIAHVFLEIDIHRLIQEEIRGLNVPSNLMNTVCRHIASVFSLDEIYAICRPHGYDEFLAVFEQKGVPIPRNRSAFDDLVKKIQEEATKRD